MVANIRGFTPNYNFKLINFDTPRWHTHEYANWGQLDAMFLQVGVPGMRGEWQNATEYLEGERVFDVQTADMYRCLVKHVSPSTGTFEQARTTVNVGFWVLQTLGVPLYRGEWASGVQYSLGDLVKVDYKYSLCVVRHVSSLSFASDVLFWTLVFDATDTIDDANQAASDAADSETAAGLSADAAALSEEHAATSAGEASDSEFAASQSATAAGTASGQAVTSAGEAAASAVTAANQAAALKGTSLTSNTVTAGTKTFETQAGKQFNVGNYVTIVATANPTGQMITGAITSYSGTTLGVNITGFLGTGTVADWQIYVSGAQGQRGVDGSGGGGIAEAPIDGKLYGRGSNTWQATVKLAGDTMTGHLVLPITPGDTNAVRKDYVDAAVGGLGVSTKLPKDGTEPMTGDLTINKITPSLYLTKTAATQNNTLFGTTAGLARWGIQLGTSGAESGSNAGSDFAVGRYNDAGVYLDNSIYISRADGKVYITPIDPTAANGVATKNYVDGRAATAAEYLNNTAGAKYLTPNAVWTASAQTTLGTGATVTPDLSLGIDFIWNPSAASVTLGNPTNVKVGQKGVIYIITQAASTSITFGSAWKFPGGLKPTLTSLAGSIDVLSFVGAPSNVLFCTFSADMK